MHVGRAAGVYNWRLERALLMAKQHPNKHIREAIQYAEQRGWRFEKAGPRAHVYGALLCPLREREGHVVRVFSTPRNPQGHAQYIRREVDKCQH